MWTRLAFLLVALAAASAEYGWKSGQEYTYQVTSKTITGLNSAPQYTGLVVKAKLVVQASSEQELIAVIDHAEKSQIHAHLQKGHEFEIPKEILQYQPFTLTKQPFIIRLKEGIIDELVISKEVPIWEVNVIKSIVSQLQVDTQGKRIIRSKMNMVPQNENEVTAVYKIMEDTVEGECEVLYDITPLPKYILQRRPYLAPLYQTVKEENMINIVKTKNFTNCNHRPGYHYGITGMTHWEPTANKMGSFLSRSSVGRVVLSGNLRQYTIHSSETTNIVTLTPELNNNNEKGTVLSRVNLTLMSVGPAKQQVEQPTHAQTIKNLVYNYNHPNSNDREARNKWDQQNELPRSQSRSRFGRSINEETTYGRKSSHDSDESISAEEWHQETPTLTSAPQNPFLPYFVGCEGHSIQHCQNVNVNQVVKKLSEQIGTQLQEPSHIPQINTLERFSILVRTIRTMSVEQLHQASEELWVKESDNTGAQKPGRSYWMAFRDAVAQAGTGPALVIIKEWILTDKIHREEAAQIVASLAESTMHPTSEYMKQFFELVQDQKVMQQEYLNTSAIYTFTKLVRMAQVDRKSIHNRYPVHAFGRFTPADDRVVAEEYIPYFGSKLQQAVQEQDSPKIQVYIRALGNMAHPKILAIFEPYLEGELPMTDFQRTLIIVSLNDLSRTHPRIARSVLYKTFSNIGEIHQVRVAAVPPVNMLQRLAQYSHDDPSIQVRSAIKSAIESAALLKNPVNNQLRRNAQAAVDMLTPKVYGIQYSRKNITDFVLKGLNVAYTDDLSYIGSEDSIFPSSIFYGLRSELQGYRRKYIKFGAMVSSIQDLVDFFDNTFSVNEGSSQEQTGKDHEFTYDKVTKMLNVEHEHMKQIEGSLLYRLAGAERYFTFDNHTMESLMEKLIQLPYTLGVGYAPVYQKLYNSHSIQIGFPTATGLPFVYTLENPRLLYGKGKIQLRTDNQKSTGSKSQLAEMVKFGGAINVHGVYTSRMQSKIGFVTPFEHQYYLAGIQEEHQINIPVRMEVDVNLNENQVKLQVQPLEKSGNLNIFEYNTQQYTSVMNIPEFKPVVEGSNTKKINLRQPYKYQRTIGDKEGLGVHVEIETQKRHLNLEWKTLAMILSRHDIISPFVFPTAGEHMENTHITVSLNKDAAKSFVLNFGVHVTRNTKSGQKVVGPAKQSPAMQHIVGEIQKGIPAPQAVVVGLDLEVTGQKNIQYSTAIGYGHSPVAEEKKFMVQYQKTGGQWPYELCFDLNTKMPFVPETDLIKAVQNQPQGQVSGVLRFGEQGCQSGAHITLAGKFERTKERVEYLKKLPQVQTCRDEMKNDNKLLSGCTNATFNANLLDRYIFTVKYDKVPVVAKNITYQVYSFLRHWGFTYLTEKLTGPQTTPENKIDIDVQFSPDLKSVNTHLVTPIGVANFKNIRVNKYFRSALVLHPTWSVVRRFGWSSLRQQYDAFCSVDKTMTKTFDNVTYPMHLTNHWIPVFVSVPKIDQENHLVGVHKVAVLTKEISGNAKEVLIHTIGNGNEFNVVIQIKPAGSENAQVVVNGQEVKIQKQHPYEYFDQKGNLIVRAYVLTTGEVKFVFPECDFELLYGVSRLRVVAGQTYKNRVLGLCGDYNGERFDYVTPKGKYLRDPEEFVASWVLSNEGSYAQLKERVEKNAVRKTVILTGVVSDQDAGRTDKRGRQYTQEQQLRGYYDSSSSSSRESGENEVQCMTQRIMVVEREGKHCFSTEPQPSCKNGCQVEQTTPMTARFVCVNKTQTSAHWAQMVTRGAKPNLSDKLNNVQELTFQGPVACSKN
ncbi:UNVERIFIED_CONTAM: hypothetical protein PYX00_009919 [Menopon gallinae]|uniref:Vitellogenin n=1 Tax=Menopon gallinae TaxID=328185 RepID=A0AAW2HD82_9NEOP